MTPDEIKTIDEIQRVTQSSGPISSSQVKKWSKYTSIDVRGALTDLLFEQGRRVDPPLPNAEVYHIVEEYYRQCLILDIKDSDYAPNRHIAGYEFVGWFKALWQDPAAPREYLIHLKQMLRDLCTQGQVSRDEIVTAVLEHLFEDKALQEFFADWKADPNLSAAFALAKEWGDSHLANPKT